VGEPLTERLFLGVALADEVRHGLAAYLEAKARPLPGKSVPPQNWHLTLRFLGPTEEQQRDRVLAFLDQHMLTLPFVMGFAGLGAFSRPARATVLWLGVSRGTEELAELAAICEEAAQAAGLAADDRPFHPHVTVSRIRPKQDVTSTVEAVPPFPLAQTVEHITLYRSLFDGGGARYEVVEQIEL